MDKAKLEKLIAASVSTAILLLFTLLAIMTYQMLVIKNKEARINELKAEIAELEKENEELSDGVEIWKSEWKIDEKARELGWRFPDDK